MPRRSHDPWADQSPVSIDVTPCPRAKYLNMSYLNDSCISLITGAQSDSFSVHRHRLFSTSSWFETALNSGLCETTIQQILLPEDDPKVVEMFVQWMYGTNPALSVFRDQTFMQLIRLYEFANRLCVYELKKYIVWKFFELRKQEQIPPVELIQYVFQSLPDGVPLRKALIAWYTYHLESAKTLTGDILDECPQLATELVLAMAEKQGGASDTLSMGPESHYEHPESSFALQPS